MHFLAALGRATVSICPPENNFGVISYRQSADQGGYGPLELIQKCSHTVLKPHRHLQVIMKTIFAAYFSAALCMLVLDAIWLTAAASRLYRPILGDILLADGFRLAPAIAFYFIYLAGIVILAVMPALETERWTKAALLGLVLGLVAYSTYDLTNQATLRTWSTTITIIDMIWGSFLTMSAATAGYLGATMVR